MAKKKRKTRDAVEILTQRYFAGRKNLDERYEQEAANLEVARKLYELRTQAGLTQRQLATLVGTSPSAFSRLKANETIVLKGSAQAYFSTADRCTR